jgi:hypothetical protein
MQLFQPKVVNEPWMVLDQDCIQNYFGRERCWIMSTSRSFQEEKVVPLAGRVRALKGKLKVCATGAYKIMAPNGPWLLSP